MLRTYDVFRTAATALKGQYSLFCDCHFRKIPQSRLIKVASFILTVLMILMFIVSILLMIIRNLQSVGF